MVDKINPAIAANIYQNNARAADFAGPKNNNNPAFKDLMEVALVDSIKTMEKGEQASARAVTGEATLPEVVQAVTAAELTLQTVVSVRDRLISAYQEIMRMPI